MSADSRPAAFDDFYQMADAALRNLAQGNAVAMAATQKIFSAIGASVGRFGDCSPATIDALRYLPEAVDTAASRGPKVIGELAHALQMLSPLLAWRQRDGAEALGEPFLSGHANALIAGPGGHEERDDVMLGASLLAPRIDYPEHQHAPEEMYIVMSEGDWYNEIDGWYTPGIGGIVYHRPWIKHTMRSTGRPLLAVWCLYAGARAVS